MSKQPAHLEDQEKQHAWGKMNRRFIATALIPFLRRNGAKERRHTLIEMKEIKVDGQPGTNGSQAP